ncbi:acyltransferase [Mycolicibacter hiberniae]|uniref:Acetyltransferase n=1 Tax=Mycolicibacter hiberniae TaxID=29314 RepID=A0A7I7WZP0_9MYCO|nr:hypothetical protein [Mycolicibacter hiberniae]MCV7086504.1 hypothetical protein [Mycolicibacter hiberniae]BBZ22077.1 hypothetical protein MHIB_04950 [Mycolicibacter hiberniae]
MSAHRPNKWLSLFAWLLPSGSFKLWALRSLGNHIGHDVFLGPNLVLNCGNFSIGDGAAIMNFNIFKQLSSVELGPRSVIGRFNQLTAAPEYQRYSPVVGTLSLGESCIITNHHYVDCSGQVIFRPFSAIGGVKCIIQSHSIDLIDNTSKPGRVVLGRSSGAFTASVLLMDSYLPERSVLAAGSVLTKAKPGHEMPACGLYGGAPAHFIREIEGLQWWDRAETNTPVVPFDDEKLRAE